MTQSIVRRALALLSCVVTTLGAQSPTHRAEERAVLAELVNINSSTGTIGVQRVGRAIAARMRAAGFAAADVQLLGPSPTLTAVVIRYRGRSGATKPILR